MNPVLLNLQNSLAAAGFSRPMILGGPNPEKQALGVVLGDLSRVPADGYAVSYASAATARVFGRPLMSLPAIHIPVLKDRMAMISRESVSLFLEAGNAGLRSLALAVPEENFFGDLDIPICVRLIMAAADIFWRLHSENPLQHVVVAVQSSDFALPF